MRHLYGWLIALAYLLQLKRWAIGVQRFLLERHAPDAPLQAVSTPEELAAYIARGFVWRDDTEGRTFKFWDWPSKPTVVQARLNDTTDVGDGDCDDISIYAGTLLRQMSGVSRVLQLCVGYQGGAHVVPVYECRGAWYTLNGRIGIRILEGVYGERSAGIAAVALTIRQMRPDDPEQAPRWWVLETLDNRLVARGPV